MMTPSHHLRTGLPIQEKADMIPVITRTTNLSAPQTPTRLVIKSHAQAAPKNTA